MQAKLEKLIAVGSNVSAAAGLIEAAGLDGSRVWAASPWVEGMSLADLVLHHGRFPPQAVLEIARAMLGELVALEAAGLVHGDIRPQNVLVANDGEVSIPHPGLRGVIRPHEGLSYHDVVPDACSTLAPERVSEGAEPTVASDLFACGCVWWHMLCGRPPRPGGTGCPGGDTLARLRTAQAAVIDDLHHWAADVPDVLVAAIVDCLQEEPQKRSKSMAELAQRLGPVHRRGRQAIARCLVAAARPRAPWLQSKRAEAKRPHPHRFTVAALALLAGVAVAWPLWVAHNRPQGAGSGERGAGSREQGARSGEQGARSGEQAATGRVTTSADTAPRRPPPRPMLDRAVTPAGYSDARDTAIPAVNGLEARATVEELRLPTDRAVRGELLQFKAGQRVRALGGRARLVVPREGLTVQADRISFENIDFVAEEPADRQAGRDGPPGALIRLLAAECEFVGCSFQAAIGSPPLSAAIVWQHASAERPNVGLPSGRIRMKDCVFRRVGVGIESHVHGAMGLEIVNSLYLGPGPMLRLAHAPAVDEPVGIHLSQVTLREAEALVDCCCVDLADPSGEIRIEASACVFAPRAQSALLVLTSDAAPGPLLHEVKWTGQGSVLSGQVVFGRWDGRDATRQTIDDATISIAGLVRGEVEFAGRLDGQPANSQVVNCQAPLQDSDSPAPSRAACRRKSNRRRNKIDRQNEGKASARSLVMEKMRSSLQV